MKIVAKNKNLRNYHQASEFIECGVVLKGSEIKSIRENGMDIKNAYLTFFDCEAFMIGSHIPKYELATHINHEPEAKRKLLLHKKQIIKLEHRKKAEGLTYVVASAYFKNSNILKISIAIVKGIKKSDKRETEKKKEHKKELKKYF